MTVIGDISLWAVRRDLAISTWMATSFEKLQRPGALQDADASPGGARLYDAWGGTGEVQGLEFGSKLAE